MSKEKLLFLLSCLFTSVICQGHPFLFPFEDYPDFVNEYHNQGNDDLPEKFQVQGYSAQHTTYTGYIKVRPTTGSSLFYLLSAPSGKQFSDGAPLILWLNGGPGCASMFGNMLEIGPQKVVKIDPTTNQTTYGPINYNWNDNYTLLFIDSPIGTGFSFANAGDITGTSELVATDLVTFLQRFFLIWTELKFSSFYIYGESYAGHYIPALANRIISTTTIKLDGIGIGNGWVDPISQLSFGDAFLFASGIISQSTRLLITDFQNQILIDIMNGDWSGIRNKSGQINSLLDQESFHVNRYNVREYPSSPPLVSGDDTALFQRWANLDATKKLFNVPSTINFATCNNNVSKQFTTDGGINFRPYLDNLIGKTKILLFQGQDDSVCHTPGVSNYLQKLKFDSPNDIRKVKKQPFIVNGKVVGTYRNAGMFTYVVLYNSGHMVPSDVPQNARSMVALNIDGVNPFP